MKNESEKILLSLHPEYSKCLFCECFFHVQNTYDHLFTFRPMMTYRRRSFQKQTCLMCNLIYTQISGEKDQKNPKQETLFKCYPPHHIPYRNKNDWLRMLTSEKIRRFYDNKLDKYRLF